MLKSIFKIEFIPKFRSGGKNGCYGIQTSKKIVADLFFKFGFKSGKKTHTIEIPKYIKNSNNKIKFSFIRGYFDTDGCLRFDKINKDTKHTYPKIEFSTVSTNMNNDLFIMLKELGFRAHKWKSRNEYKICLAGKDNLSKFIKNIRPKNKKHLNKYFFWKKYGYYMPAIICPDRIVWYCADTNENLFSLWRKIAKYSCCICIPDSVSQGSRSFGSMGSNPILGATYKVRFFKGVPFIIL